MPTPLLLTPWPAVVAGRLSSTQFDLVQLLSGWVVISSAKALVPAGAQVQVRGGVDWASSPVQAVG